MQILLRNNLYALIPIVVNLRRSHDQIDWGGAMETYTESTRATRRKEEKDIQNRKKTNTQYNVAPSIKQIVCMSTGEEREILLKFRRVQ